MAKIFGGLQPDAIVMEEFKKRSDIHWARKIWHLTGVGAMAICYAYAPLWFSKAMILFAWVLFVPVDLLRQRFPSLNEVMLHVFKPIMRDSEAKGLAGTTSLLTGVGLIVWFFPRDVVLLSLMFLAVADPFASYFGIRFGRDKIWGQKSLQGSMAAFVICAGLTAGFLWSNGLMLEHLVTVSLLAGLIGMAAELVQIFKLDDNLTLPVISASFLTLLFNLFGAF